MPEKSPSACSIGPPPLACSPGLVFLSIRYRRRPTRAPAAAVAFSALTRHLLRTSLLLLLLHPVNPHPAVPTVPHGTCVLKLSHATQCSAPVPLVCPKPPSGPVTSPFSLPFPTCPLTAASRPTCARLVPLPHANRSTGCVLPLLMPTPRFLLRQSVVDASCGGPGPGHCLSHLPGPPPPPRRLWPVSTALAHPAALVKSLVFCLFRRPGSCA
ncbi:hypothetical protein IWX47DRAFT_317734 [Phyllosticta citricarpa]